MKKDNESFQVTLTQPSLNGRWIRNEWMTVDDITACHKENWEVLELFPHTCKVEYTTDKGEKKHRYEYRADRS